MNLFYRHDIEVMNLLGNYMGGGEKIEFHTVKLDQMLNCISHQEERPDFGGNDTQCSTKPPKF